MDKTRNTKADAFQWKDHHGTASSHWSGLPLECTRKLTNQMEVRIDAGFHHRNPNVHFPPSFVDNPGNAFDPKYIPLTIFNPSHVDHLYIGRDTVVAFADEPKVDMYNVELTREE